MGTRQIKRHQSGTVDRYHAAMLDLIANPGKYPKNTWATRHGISAGLPALLIKLGMAKRVDGSGLVSLVNTFTREDALALLELSNDFVSASVNKSVKPSLPTDFVRLKSPPPTIGKGFPWSLKLPGITFWVDVRRTPPSIGDHIEITGIPSLRNNPGEAPSYVGLSGTVKHVYADGSFNLKVDDGGMILVGRRYKFKKTPTRWPKEISQPA